MIRFIDLRKQCTGYRFAWFNTVSERFEAFGFEQVFQEWKDFAEVCPPDMQYRYRGLCPAWVFAKKGK